MGFYQIIIVLSVINLTVVLLWPVSKKLPENSIILKLLSIVFPITIISHVLCVLWYWICNVLLSTEIDRYLSLVDMNKIYFPTIALAFIILSFIIGYFTEGIKKSEQVKNIWVKGIMCFLVIAGIMYIPVFRINNLALKTEIYKDIIDDVLNSKIVESDETVDVELEPFLPIEVIGGKVLFSENIERAGFNVAKSKNDVKSIIIVRKNAEKVRSYTSACSDFQWVFNVSVIDLPSKRIISKIIFKGSRPPDRSGTLGGSDIFGVEPWEEVFAHISRLIIQTSQ